MVVLVLCLSLPYTKLAHGVYRVLAVTGRDYQAMVLLEQARAEPAGRPASRGRRDPFEDGAHAQGEVARPLTRDLLGRGHEELLAFSDEEIAQAYYELRDEAVADRAGTYYPNTKLLFGTALERRRTGAR